MPDSFLATAFTVGTADKTSSNKVGDQVHYEITGIDLGAGLMKATEKTINDYDLKDWTLNEGSSAA